LPQKEIALEENEGHEALKEDLGRSTDAPATETALARGRADLDVSGDPKSKDDEDVGASPGRRQIAAAPAPTRAEAQGDEVVLEDKRETANQAAPAEQTAPAEELDAAASSERELMQESSAKGRLAAPLAKDTDEFWSAVGESEPETAAQADSMRVRLAQRLETEEDGEQRTSLQSALDELDRRWPQAPDSN